MHVELLFMFLLVAYSLWRNFCSFLCPFFNEIVLFFWLSLMDSSYIMYFEYCLPYEIDDSILLLRLPFHLVDSFLYCTALRYHLFSLVVFVLAFNPKITAQTSLLSRFFPRNFMVSGHTCKSLICFVLIFVYGRRYWSSFILLHVAVRLFQHQLLRRLSFYHSVFLAPLLYMSWPHMHVFISGSQFCFIHLCVYFSILFWLLWLCSLVWNMKCDPSGFVYPSQHCFG